MSPVEPDLFFLHPLKYAYMSLPTADELLQMHASANAAFVTSKGCCAGKKKVSFLTMIPSPPVYEQFADMNPGTVVCMIVRGKLAFEWCTYGDRIALLYIRTEIIDGRIMSVVNDVISGPVYIVDDLWDYDCEFINRVYVFTIV